MPPLGERTRKERIAHSFSNHAATYDEHARLQRYVAQALAERVARAACPPAARILEIGCGTGFLTSQIRGIFPDAALTATDIAPHMLDMAQARVGEGPIYRLMDGENPQGLAGSFQFILSSLAFQWFEDLGGALQRLFALLAPGGRLMFATLGDRTFHEWRQVHQQLDLPCGTPVYPAARDLPLPHDMRRHVDEELVHQSYRDGRDFLRSLKALGAGEPIPGYRPLPAPALRRLLARLDGEFSVTYHVIYGEIVKP